MKTKILGFAAVAMLASCTNNEIVDAGFGKNEQSDLIAFQPTSNATPSRGAIVGIATLEGLTDGFKVFGIANAGNQPSGTTASDLFTGVNNTNYKFTSTVWDWVSQEGKKWPQASDGKYPVQFFAAHNAPATLAVGTTDLEIAPADDVYNQKDILSAVTEALQDAPASKATNLKFKHILSAIQFKIHSPENYTVDVKDVKIVNVTQKRKFNFLTQAWSSFTSTGKEMEYTYFHSSTANNMQSLSFAKANGAVPIHTLKTNGSGANTQAEGQLMVVPQSSAPMNLADYIKAGKDWTAAQAQGSTAWPTDAAKTALKAGAYIQLTYKMRDASGKDIVGWTSGNIVGSPTQTPTANYYVTVLYPLDLNASGTTTGKAWEMGKRYTYTISLGHPDSSNGTVVDPDFEGDDDTDTNKPVDNPASKPGEPVTQGKITFIVTVDEWADTGNGVDIK